jgi:hypothetical protein
MALKSMHCTVYIINCKSNHAHGEIYHRAKASKLTATEGGIAADVGGGKNAGLICATEDCN